MNYPVELALFGGIVDVEDNKMEILLDVYGHDTSSKRIQCNSREIINFSLTSQIMRTNMMV